MQEKGMSNIQLAEKMGTSAQYIGQIANGRNGATMAQYERIAEILGVKVWQLFAPKSEYLTIEEHEQQTAELREAKRLADRPDLIVIDRETGETKNYYLK